ncbi:MobF family relaxase [Fimbriiglobus ruber]|uniref:IncW plasmid conjugative relaxase protein TrwC (TraI) n=1 Tax=Fimbriiglobus ruber TaxID=1908690 RepID=A0A225DII1_9BACT|nr:MobF family relaxase [Fimbriiglobus ruber]OWK39504.1 IncW plasmid conjugative relaxase protein TrwC (TraI) [Fimbriiglobus ruber]
MLRINAIPNTAAAKAYYALSDYMIEGENLEAHWHGKGADLLGLEGTVDQQDFERLCDNLHPKSGLQLTAKHLENRRVGYDLTFSVPKSISILYALGQDDRLPNEFRGAVADTMAEIEREISTRVRRKGADFDRKTGNLVWTDYLHHTSRPINGTPDPQLHVHAVVFNATFDSEEKQWKAGQFGGIKTDAPYFQAMFRTRLANRLQALGYDIRKTKDDFEITGVPERTIKEFSRRTTLIEKTADLLGIKKPETKAKLGATTREPKKEGQTWDSLVKGWEDRVTLRERHAIHETVVNSHRETPLPELANAAGLDWAMRHSFERSSVVSERELVTTALKHGLGSVTPEGIYKELGSRKDLIRRDVDGRTMVTTKGVLNEERKILEFAQKGRGRFRPLASPDLFPQGGVLSSKSEHAASSRFGQTVSTDSTLTPTTPAAHSQPMEGSTVGKAKELPADTDLVTSPSNGQEKGHPDESKQPSNPQKLDTAYGSTCNESDIVTLTLAEQPKKVDLSPSQLAAVRHAWYSRDPLILIRGAAGTGKTTMTKALLQGVNVPWVILAPSAEASRGVLRREGFEGAETLAKFLLDDETQQKARNGLIVLDEASLAGAHDMARLIQIADSIHARILLLGDRRQHKSVARGDVLTLLEDRAGLPVAEVSEIRRQGGEYREAVKLASQGRVSDAFEKLDRLGWVKQGGDIAGDYVAAIKDGKSVLVVSPTHAEGDQVTAAIRTRLKQEGKLKGEDHVFETLVPLHLTEAERGESMARGEGRVAQFVRAQGDYRASDRIPFTPTGNDPSVCVPKPDRIAVYEKARLALASGDLVRITSNGKDLSGSHRLNNGATYTVDGFTDAGNIRLNNGWVISKDFGHLAPGYVVTSHASQGKTVDIALLAMGNQSVRAMGSEQFYVSTSRARQKTQIYCDDKEAVRDAIQRDDKRFLASDLVRAPRKGVREKLKRRVAFLRELGSRVMDGVRNRGMEKRRDLTHELG